MDFISILTTANEAGFQAGSLLGVAIIYWRLSKQNNKHWNKLIATLGDHNKINDERFNKIENHIGIKK